MKTRRNDITQFTSGVPLYFYEIVKGMDFDKKSYMLERILLINIKRGTVRVEINGREFTLTSQNFVFLPPHSSIYVVKASYDMEAEVVGFMMALQQIILQKLGHAFFAYVFKRLVWQMSDHGKEAINAFCVMYRELCSKPVDMYSGDIANSLFNVFLLSFYQDVRDLYEEEEQITVNGKNIAAKFAMLLHDNFRQHHNVSFYAEQLCITSKYLTQIIRTHTGLSPKSAIDRALGVEALFLLSNTSSNIQEISNQLGFPDQSYFGRFFKRLFGMSPIHYRTNPNLQLIERLGKMEQPQEDYSRARM